MINKIGRAIAVLVLSGVCATAFAQAQGADVVTSHFGSFVDGVMEQAIVDGQTAGAVVAVVQDGRLVVGRGYGYADLANRVPVQARSTQFRIGSISKVLTWMAVLQLVEAGKVDLDANINNYLDGFAKSA